MGARLAVCLRPEGLFYRPPATETHTATTEENKRLVRDELRLSGETGRKTERNTLILIKCSVRPIY